MDLLQAKLLSLNLSKEDINFILEKGDIFLRKPPLLLARKFGIDVDTAKLTIEALKSCYISEDDKMRIEVCLKDNPEFPTPDDIALLTDLPLQTVTLYLQNKPLDDKPLGNKPLYDKPLGNKPLDDKPLGNKPLDDKPLGNKPLDDKPLGNKPLYDKPLGNKPLYDKSLGNKPLYDKSLGNKPLYDKPLGNKPLGDTQINDIMKKVNIGISIQEIVLLGHT